VLIVLAKRGDDRTWGARSNPQCVESDGKAWVLAYHERNGARADHDLVQQRIAACRQSVRDLIAGPEFSAPWSAEPAELN
jgi:hypothetical protein